jgi:hypothetical protein
MAQVVEHLLSKCIALRSTSQYQQKRKKKKSHRQKCVGAMQ